MSVWGVGQRLVVDVACRMQGSAVCSTWQQPTMEVCHSVGSVICCGPLLRLRAKGCSVSMVVFTVQSRLACCWQLLHPHQKGSLRAGLACCWVLCTCCAFFHRGVVGVANPEGLLRTAGVVPSWHYMGSIITHAMVLLAPICLAVVQCISCVEVCKGVTLAPASTHLLEGRQLML